MTDPKYVEQSWLSLELEDDMDEEFEQEADDRRLPEELKQLLAAHRRTSMPRQTYFSELLRLQSELIKLQDWVAHAGLKIVVLFELFLNHIFYALYNARHGLKTLFLLKIRIEVRIY